MEISIRSMLLKEAFAVWKLGLITFHSMEGIFMGKPKNAVIALDGDQIVGAATYKVYKYRDGKLGYVDYAFVDHRYHGKGIGTKLYAAAVETLKKAGCTQVSALVRGDNPGSFTLFEKQEMYRCTLSEAKRVLGIRGLSKLILASPLGWGPAVDCYLSDVTPRKDGNRQILWYLCVNLILMLFGCFRFQETFYWALAAGATLMLVTVLLGASIHLIKKHTYQFRLSMGGYFVTSIVMLIGGFFPLLGKWYPKQFENTDRQRKERCIAAIIEWIGILAVYIVAKVFLGDCRYGKYLEYFSYALTVFRMLPTFPFSEYGGRRVFEYRKSLYAALWILSAAVLMISKQWL